MYKSEIVKRLNQLDYRRLPRLLDIAETFENITDEENYINMLKIADICGIKYISFFKLNNNQNISNVINNLTVINYSPNLPYIEGQEELTIAKISKNNNNFDIICNFYQVNDIWIKSADGRSQTLETVQERRVIHINYDDNFNILTATIDPLRIGADISEKLNSSLETVLNSFGINFNEYFTIVELDSTIYDKIDNQEFRPHKIINKDENRNIEFLSEAKNPTDSLIDQDCYIRMRGNQLDLNRMKLKNDATNMSIELFGRDIIRIWNKSNWEQLDEFKRSFITVL